MNTGTLLITGTPRSGTTMTCHLLNKLPNVVALHEPMKAGDFKGLDGPLAGVERFCRDQRRSILERRLAISKQVGGAVPTNPVGTGRTEDGLRRRMVSKGEIAIDKPLDEDFTLAIKHCGSFTAILDTLVTRFPVYAVVRNPLAVVASWSTVEFAIQRGHMPVAEGLDRDLKAKLAVTDDVLDRQIHILAWFHHLIRRYLPDEAIIRYESIVETGGKALAVVQPSAASMEEPLESQNTSDLYDHELMLRIGERLLESEGAHWETYSKASVERLLHDVSVASGR
jgi:hypothetical protein